MQTTIDLAQINKKNRRNHQPRKQGWKPPDQGSVKIMLDLYGLQPKYSENAISSWVPRSLVIKCLVFVIFAEDTIQCISN
jgi:hypothetical protein